MKKYILPVLALGMLITLPVFGAIIPTAPTFTFDNPLGETNDIGTLLSKIINFLIVLAIPISAILIVYAGYLYITSAGNAEKIKTAQKALIWALVGFAVVLIASSVPAIIQEFLYGKEEAPAEAPAEAPEAPAEPAEPDSGGTSAPAEVPTETPEAPAESVETGTYKDCELNIVTGETFCKTYTWSGTGSKPNNKCEIPSDCQKLVYKSCTFDPQAQQSYCKSTFWDDGLGPKPNNECETHDECQYEHLVPNANPPTETPTETPAETPAEPASKCFDCGGTWWDSNICDEKECLALGDCYFSPSTWLVWTPGCYPNSK